MYFFSFFLEAVHAFSLNMNVLLLYYLARAFIFGSSFEYYNRVGNKLVNNSCFRVDARTANFPWGQRGGPAGGDHQGVGHPHQGTDQGNESQLHRVQVPPDQGPPLAQGMAHTITIIVFRNIINPGVPSTD